MYLVECVRQKTEQDPSVSTQSLIACTLVSAQRLTLLVLFVPSKFDDPFSNTCSTSELNFGVLIFTKWFWISAHPVTLLPHLHKSLVYISNEGSELVCVEQCMGVCMLN